MIRIREALEYIRPGEQWSLIGDEYSGLTWLDSTDKPTEAEVNQAKVDLQTHFDSEKQRISEIEAEQSSSGMKKVTVSQARNYIDNQIDNAATVAEVKEAIKKVLKKMVVHIIK